MKANTPNIASLHQKAQRALLSNRAHEAHAHCLEILKQDPTFADAWFLCAVIAAQNQQIAKAIEILERAISLAPANPEYRAEKGKLLLARHEHSAALDEARTALSLKPNTIPTLNTLGTVFSRAGEHETALACFESALELLKEAGEKTSLSTTWQADFYFNLATSLQFAGSFEASEKAYEKAIALQPDLFKAHSALSTLRTQSQEKNHLKRLESLRSKVKTPRDQLHLGHAIAKEQEDLGEYVQSLQSLRWAKEAQLKDARYQFEQDNKQFELVRELFADAPLDKGFVNAEPIFIVGMPRTGTTLVEQIVSSHSNVFAAGELQNFPLQVKRLTQTPSQDVLDIETLRASSSMDAKTLGEAYVQSTRPRTGHTPRFIDKLPLNFMYIGLIARALPNANIICLRRDPMDTCLSNYRQLFAVDFKHYHYNYDLMNCGRYFIEFDRLMQHWQQTMPGKVHEVHYEALVENPEETAMNLINYCELDWEPQCLDFHRRKTSVATPSAVQVRQGIYQTSVNRWQKYGDEMEPLYQLLQSAGFYGG